MNAHVRILKLTALLSCSQIVVAQQLVGAYRMDLRSHNLSKR